MYNISITLFAKVLTSDIFAFVFCKLVIFDEFWVTILFVLVVKVCKFEIFNSSVFNLPNILNWFPEISFSTLIVSDFQVLNVISICFKPWISFSPIVNLVSNEEILFVFAEIFVVFVETLLLIVFNCSFNPLILEVDKQDAGIEIFCVKLTGLLNW